MGSTATKIDPEGIVMVLAGLNSRENGRRSAEVTELWILGDLIKSDITRKAPLLRPVLIRLF